MHGTIIVAEMIINGNIAHSVLSLTAKCILASITAGTHTINDYQLLVVDTVTTNNLNFFAYASSVASMGLLDRAIRAT